MRIRPPFLAGYIEYRGYYHYLHPRARGQGKQAGRVAGASAKGVAVVQPSGPS
jgi:hypothetical protein